MYDPYTCLVRLEYRHTYTGHDLKEGQLTSRTYMHTNHITISRVLHYCFIGMGGKEAVNMPTVIVHISKF